MPTANSAANSQPKTKPLATGSAPPRSILRHLALGALGVLLGVSIAVPLETATAPAAAARARPNNCEGWSSTKRPPKYIRVLRVKSGRIEKVRFRKYVVTVMGKEWPGYLPQALVEAGAVAVKQFAWKHALGKGRMTANGRCYDLRDSTADQLYRPQKARIGPDIRSAVDKTWDVRLLKSGNFFLTAYRSGSKKRCGSDADGRRLYARSARRCANKGWGYQRILKRYYSHLRIVGGGSSAAQTRAQSTSSQSIDMRLIDDRSGKINWHGQWRRLGRSRAIHNTLTISRLRGSSATFSFVGRALEIHGRRGPHRGWIDIYVNGKWKERVDLLAKKRKNRVVLYDKTWAKTKTRHVRIVVRGNSNRHRADIDAIRIGA